MGVDEGEYNAWRCVCVCVCVCRLADGMGGRKTESGGSWWVVGFWVLDDVRWIARVMMMIIIIALILLLRLAISGQLATWPPRNTTPSGEHISGAALLLLS